MIKSTFYTVFFLIIILGLTVKEAQGQDSMCHKILSEIDCGAGSCGALCQQLWEGTGKCFQLLDQTFACLCNFPCRS
ncbi:putative defensin-like protein 126 [Raphanus sativus]|uniref:Defensin-like protein 126 n=1 Tax=Raphanus sativus TaxID=3726 RepID=A0A6J0M1B3_RAPSA|nr:putative defensin-like protein 126 [Raphanus sativus]